MTTTLPTPSHGLEYTNPETGDKFRYDSDAGAWEGFEGIDESGDSMTGTIAYPDMLINGNTLTADEFGEDAENGGGDGWADYTSYDDVQDWSGVIYSKEKKLWVAVAHSSNGNRHRPGEERQIMYSSDGINWKGALSGPAVRWSKIAYGNGKFVAVANSGQYGGSATNKVIYSEDGINWHRGPSADDTKKLYDIAYGDGKFVVMAEDGLVMYSEDAITWNTTNAANGNTYLRVAYGDGKFVAVGQTTPQTIMYSTDGINWAGLNGRCPFRSIAYGDGLWVAVVAPAYSSTPKIETSTDGIIWTPNSNYEYSESWFEYMHTYCTVAYGNGQWHILGGGLGDSRILSSYDGGLNWETTDLKEQLGHRGDQYNDVAYGDGKFVAVMLVAENYDPRVLVLNAPEEGNLYFNGDPVVVDKGQSKALARSVSGLSSLLGSSRFYQAEEPSDSFGIDNGTLWLNPSNAKLSIYYDSDWNQLN